MRSILTLLLLFGLTVAGNSQAAKIEEEKFDKHLQAANLIASMIKSEESVDKIKTLLTKNNINLIDSTGYSLLSQAIRSKNIELVKELIELGANPNLQNKDFLLSTPLMQCTNYNLLAAAELLIANGADVNIQDKQNDPVIHWSAYYGQVELTKLFLDHGANPNLKSIHSDGVMHVALKEYRVDVVDLLMDYNIGSIVPSKEDKVIIDYINKGDLKGLKQLNEKFNPNILDASGTPVLVKATSKGHFEIVKYLLEKGADINAMNITGHTALSRSTFFSYNKISNFLIERGADINKTDKRFFLPPIIAAIRSNNLDIGKLLVKKNVDINIKDGINGMTPIMWAVAYQNIEFVKLLLSQNPDLSVVSNYDDTVFTLTKDDRILSLLNKIKKRN